MKNYWVKFWAHPLLMIRFLLPLNRVSTPRNSSGKRQRPGLDHGTFFWGAVFLLRMLAKKFLLWNVHDFRLRGNFSRKNCSCAVSMCIWTAQARTKCGKFCLGLFFSWQAQLLEDLGTTFSDVHVRFDPAGLHKVRVRSLGRGIFPRFFSHRRAFVLCPCTLHGTGSHNVYG